MRLLVSSKDSKLRRKLLYVRCETDTGLFAAFFFPHYCEQKFSPMHHEMLADLADKRRNKRRVYAAPRGHAKSALITMIDTIHDVVYKTVSQERFIGILSETEPQAISRLKEIADEFKDNARLREVYGDFTSPHWLKKEIITSNNVKIMAFGAQSKIRGTRHKQWRFTKLKLDDVENRKSVLSPEQRHDQREWLEKDVLKAGITGVTNYDFVGTVLHNDALLMNLIRNPGWRRRVYKAVIKWPEGRAKQLWDIWTAIITDLMRPDRIEDADAYYLAHKDEMLEGVECLWPERFPFVELMKVLIFEGRASFETELQNNPYDPTMALFQYDKAARCRVDWESDTIIRGDGRFVKLSACRRYMYHDPAYGESVRGDWAAIPVGLVDDFGYLYVVDAAMKRVPTSQQIKTAFELAARWKPRCIGLETNSGWKLLGEDYEDEADRRKKHGEYSWLPIEGVFNTGEKGERIASLEPKIANKWIIFGEGLPEEFEEQMRNYPTHSYDDAPDSLAGLMNVAKKYEAGRLFGGMPDSHMRDEEKVA